MAKFWVALIVCAQILVLCFMAGQREYIRATGDIVYFRTAPLDPRDPFRGDYVRLDYPINTLHSGQFINSPIQFTEDEQPNKDDFFYVSLRQDESGIASFANIYANPPEDQLFIKGRSEYFWYNRGNFRLNLRYGIEQLFIEQGKGLDMEERMGRRNELQIPLEVEVALGKAGTAVTRDYRWSELGIKTEILPPISTTDEFVRDDVTSPRLKITIQNVSTHPLILADNEYHCAFHLQSLGRSTATVRSTNNVCDSLSLEASNLIELAPEQEQEFTFDLNRDRWHILNDDILTEVGSFEFREQFRLVYTSPPQAVREQLNGNNNFWIGELPSSAFYGAGRID